MISGGVKEKLFFMKGNMLSHRYAGSPVMLAMVAYQPLVALETAVSCMYQHVGEVLPYLW